VVLFASDLEVLDELIGGGLDVGGDVEHLGEALALVQVLAEPEAGTGDRGERLAPPKEVAGEALPAVVAVVVLA